MAGNARIAASRGGIEYAGLGMDERGKWLQPFIKFKVLDNDENMIIIVDGRPRVGKSNASIYLAETLRPYGFTFPTDTSYICMGTLEFIRLLRTRPPRGSVIVYEEAPVGHNTRQWHSIENEMLNRILNTFGFMNYVVILNGVNFNDLDKQARKLIHLEINCITKNTRSGIVAARPKWITYNAKNDRFYYTNVLLGRGNKLNTMRITKCSRELWTQYQAKKFKWNYDALDDMEKDLKVADAKKEAKNKVVDIDGLAAKVRAEPEKFKTIESIANAFKLSAFAARRVRAAVSI